MKWYYITVTFLPEYKNNEALVARCLKILHGFSYRHETRVIGVSFPCWQESTIGEKISFVSTDKATLAFLLTQPYYKKMEELNYFRISTMLAVPEYCEYVFFKRNNTMNKYSPAGMAKRLKRLEKRAIARGELFNAAKYDVEKTITVNHFHQIEETSTTNQKSFLINIEMERGSRYTGNGKFSSYGLANSEGAYQAVPFV